METIEERDKVEQSLQIIAFIQEAITCENQGIHLSQQATHGLYLVLEHAQQLLAA